MKFSVFFDRKKNAISFCWISFSAIVSTKVMSTLLSFWRCNFQYSYRNQLHHLSIQRNSVWFFLIPRFWIEFNHIILHMWFFLAMGSFMYLIHLQTLLVVKSFLSMSTFFLLLWRMSKFALFLSLHFILFIILFIWLIGLRNFGALEKSFLGALVIFSFLCELPKILSKAAQTYFSSIFSISFRDLLLQSKFRCF